MPETTERSTRDALRHFATNLYQIAHIAYDAAPRVLVGTLCIRVLRALLPAATAYMFKLVFDRLGLVLAGEADFAFQQDILPFLLGFGVLIVLSQGMNALDSYFNEELGRRLQLHTSTLVYQHLLSLQGMHYFESPRFHDTLQQTTNSLQWLGMQLIHEASGLIGALLTLLSFFGIVFVFSPLLALVLVVAIIPTFIAQLRFRRKRFKLSWHNSPKERQAWYVGSILAQTQYAKEVRLFNLGEYLLNKYVNATQSVHQAQRELNQDELRVNTVLNVLNAALTVGSYVVVVGQAFARQITLGDVTLFIEAVRNVQSQLQILAWSVVSLSERTLFFTHYQNLLAMQSKLSAYEPLTDAPPLRETIELRGVSFRYVPDGDPVLDDINLTIRKGESLALVGLNGAGKTTLVKLLARFYDPTAGEILWDGVDIRHFTPQSLRSRLGAVLQDFIRYDITARENIGIGDVTRIDDVAAIRSAAQQVGVDAFITEMPQGYETILSRWLVEQDEEGTDLSGGQWQKIAISRAYLRDVDVLMLDEPTSALDAEAEYEIYQRFAEIAAGRVTILISHRFSTVRMAQKIAVLEKGCIVEYGTHADLMAHKGTYARLYNLQAAQYV